MKRNRRLVGWLLVIGLAACCAAAAEASGEVLRVPEDHPSLRAGIDAARPGDTVVVADGTYRGPDNRNLNFQGKAITVRSASGPWRCIIDCEGAGNAFTFDSNEGPDSVLAGFTITNGRALYGAGLLIEEASPSVSRCIFLNNAGERPGGVDGYGGAIYVSDDILVDSLLPWTEHGPCRPVISNCVFAGNTADYGGAVYCYSDGPLSATEPVLIHCTFSGNHADFEGGALYNWMSAPTVVNCIFWGNTAGTLFPEIRNLSASPSVTYCDVQGGYPGEGNFDLDPRFAGRNDTHLLPGSPCIDRGTDVGVYRDIDGDPRPLLTGFDVGADEYAGPCWDADSDGSASGTCGGPDCDDTNANIFPGAPNPFCNCRDPYPGGTNEISGDGVDNNCNGLTDEWD